MARIRTIKPEFFTSLTVAGLPLAARLTFIGLWTHVDDSGFCVDDARLIRAAIWPLDDRLTSDVEDDLKLLTEASLIVRYVVNDRAYLAVCGWAEHQKINRPTPSKLPGPEQVSRPPEPTPTSGDALFSEDSVSTPGGGGESSPPERKGTGKGTGKGTSAAPRTPPRRPPTNTATPEARVANTVDEHLDGMCNWNQIMGIAKSALRITGATEESVAKAMCDINDAGKPITKQLVGQVLSGVVDASGQPRTNGRRHQSEGYHNGIALARRLHEEELAQLAIEGNR